MKNFKNMSEIHSRAERVLAMQTAGKKPVRRVFNYILKNVRKNQNIPFSVFTLMTLFKHSPSFERSQEIFNLLASKMSDCSIEEDDHVELIGYLIINCCNPVAFAMCHVIRYKWGFIDESEKESVKDQMRILDEYGIGHYFKINVRTIVQIRKSGMLEKVS